MFGCIHNYTLKTADVKKLQNANLFIQNGLGVEDIMQNSINSFSNLKIINSTESIENVISDEDEINGHTWTSINNYIKQVEDIKDKLKQENKENANIYEENANNYIKKLLNLKQKYETELEGLKGKKVISLNESFAYLERDLQLESIQIHTNHEESTISAEKLKEVINKMKNEDIKIIIIDKDDNEKNATNLANETGSTIYKLNSCMKGSLNKDTYLNQMEENLNILKQMI